MKKINLQNLYSGRTDEKYCTAKKAIALSKDNPEELYPDFDFFVKLLDSENRIIKWTAIIIIGNLSKVDYKNIIDKIITRFIGFLKGEEMITANNTIAALAQIAKNKPIKAFIDALPDKTPIILY